mgnify:CR=1 FL=1
MNNNKLHLGCGHKIKEGWINHDIADLPGVDLVHDLNQYPWPIDDNTIDEVFAKDVLEHLPNLIRVMEEIYRITKPGAKVYIEVPYWNSWEAITDPTHVTQFNEYTFTFFDPSHWRCKDRPYYTKARFKINKLGFDVRLNPYLVPIIPIINRRIPFIGRQILIFNRPMKWFFGLLASFLNNIIIGLEVHLERSE